jgi:hypothetical protein
MPKRSASSARAARAGANARRTTRRIDFSDLPEASEPHLRGMRRVGPVRSVGARRGGRRDVATCTSHFGRQPPRDRAGRGTLVAASGSDQPDFFSTSIRYGSALDCSLLPCRTRVLRRLGASRKSLRRYSLHLLVRLGMRERCVRNARTAANATPGRRATPASSRSR